MTFEELKLLLQRGRTEQLVAALAPLSEIDRKKLAGKVVALRKEFTRLQKEPERQPWLPPKTCPFCGKQLLSVSPKYCFECGKDWQEPDDGNPTSPAGSEMRARLLKFAILGGLDGSPAHRLTRPPDGDPPPESPISALH